MDDMVQFRARPEANLVNRVADSGAIESDDTAILGLEAAWVNGPLSAQAEYSLASVSASGAGMDADYSGFYAFISFFLTGEHRNYKTSSAAFDRVKPAENFGVGSGAIEVAARYSMLDLDDGPSTDELNDVTLGVNWYLNPNARIMLNVVHAEFEDGAVDDSMDALMMRFQVDW
jgi:phosphate-selective porin OprO/OprP